VQHTLPMSISDHKRVKDRLGKQVGKFFPLGRNELSGCQLAGDQLQRKKIWGS